MLYLCKRGVNKSTDVDGKQEQSKQTVSSLTQDTGSKKAIEKLFTYTGAKSS